MTKEALASALIGFNEADNIVSTIADNINSDIHYYLEEPLEEALAELANYLASDDPDLDTSELEFAVARLEELRGQVPDGSDGLEDIRGWVEEAQSVLDEASAALGNLATDA
jgi:hypothetical protein